MDLIDRTKVERITFQEPSYSDPINVLTEVRDKVRALPTVDAKPVRHGHWVRKGLLFHCSACSYGAFKSDFVYGARYCPTCGARMDERTEE